MAWWASAGRGGGTGRAESEKPRRLPRKEAQHEPKPHGRLRNHPRPQAASCRGDAPRMLESLEHLSTVNPSNCTA